VSNRTVRVPKRPLSRTASAKVISGPSKRSLLLCLRSRTRVAREHSKEQGNRQISACGVFRASPALVTGRRPPGTPDDGESTTGDQLAAGLLHELEYAVERMPGGQPDRKSTRLNSSHV